MRPSTALRLTRFLTPFPFLRTATAPRPLPRCTPCPAFLRPASTLVSHPSRDYLAQEKADGLDIEILDPEKATFEITEAAAEQLATIAARESNPAIALRIAVESGGCHGYQYKLDLVDTRQSPPEPDDYRFSPTPSPPAEEGPTVLVDAVSLGLLKGSTLDFATELIGSSFRVLDNPQSSGKGCGCGVSFSM